MATPRSCERRAFLGSVGCFVEALRLPREGSGAPFDVKGPFRHPRIGAVSDFGRKPEASRRLHLPGVARRRRATLSTHPVIFGIYHK